MTFTNEHFTPTAITTTNPINVTIENHGFQPGDVIRATNFVVYPTAVSTGMEQLNNQSFVVQNTTTDTFDLYDVFGQTIDGRSYTPFVNNGLALFTLAGPDLFVEAT